MVLDILISLSDASGENRLILTKICSTNTVSCVIMIRRGTSDTVSGSAAALKSDQTGVTLLGVYY